MTLTIDWHRAEGHARHVMPPDVADFHATAQGTTGNDAWQDVLRHMADAGLDGPCGVTDERGMPCWSIGSIVSAARYYRPTDAQKAGEAEYRSWFPKARR